MGFKATAVRGKEVVETIVGHLERTEEHQVHQEDQEHLAHLEQAGLPPQEVEHLPLQEHHQPVVTGAMDVFLWLVWEAVQVLERKKSSEFKLLLPVL